MIYRTGKKTSKLKLFLNFQSDLQHQQVHLVRAKANQRAAQTQRQNLSDCIAHQSVASVYIQLHLVACQCAATAAEFQQTNQLYSNNFDCQIVHRE